MTEKAFHLTGGEERWSNYYLAVQREGKEVMYEVTKALYPGGTMRPDEYLKITRNFSKEDYEDTFFQQQRNILSSWPEDVSYDISKASLEWDITLHFRVLRKCCSWKSFAEKGLLRYLYCLNDLRNNVTHNVSYLTQEGLDKKLSELKDLYSSILKRVGNITHRTYEQEVNRICNNLTELSFPDSLRDNEKPSTSALEEKFDSELEDDILNQIKSELLQRYDQKRKIRPGGLKHSKPVNVSDLFSMIKLNVKSSSVISAKHIRADKILKLSDLRKPNNTLNLIGSAGSGKTTLMLYVMDQWCSEDSHMYGINDVDLLFHVDLGSVKENSVKCLVKEHFLPKSFSHIAHRRVIENLKQWKMIWILDGFDQCTQSTRSLVKEICATFSTVFVTTRPEFASTLETLVRKVDSVSEIDVIDVNSAKDIAKKLCLYSCGRKSIDSLVENFIKFTSSNGGMHRGLINSPLHVTRLCLLWLEHQTKHEAVETCIQVHISILSTTLNRLVQRLVQKTGEIRICLEQKMLQFIDTLCQVAWQMIKNDSAFLTKKQVAMLLEKCESLDLSDYCNIILSLFLDPVTFQGRKKHGQSKIYRFSENKDMEFLAARHINTLLKSDEHFKVHRIIEDDKRWSQVMVNFVGIIALENGLSRSLAKQIVDFMRGMEYRMDDWYHLLNESMGNAHLLEEMLFIFGDSQTIILDGNRLMDNWKTIVGMVCHFKFKIVVLLFETQPENLDVTVKRVQVLAHYAQNIALRCNWSVRAFSENDVVDNFLESLLSVPGCNLTEFAGHISPRAIVKSLPYSVNSLILRLKVYQQANALQTWLKRHQVQNLTLFLDFHESLIPTLLPRLTPSWINNPNSNTKPSIVFVTVNEWGISNWLARVLNRLCKTQSQCIVLSKRDICTDAKKTGESVPMKNILERPPAEANEKTADVKNMPRETSNKSKWDWGVLAILPLAVFVYLVIIQEYGGDSEGFVFLVFLIGLIGFIANEFWKTKELREYIQGLFDDDDEKKRKRKYNSDDEKKRERKYNRHS